MEKEEKRGKRKPQIINEVMKFMNMITKLALHSSNIHPYLQALRFKGFSSLFSKKNIAVSFFDIEYRSSNKRKLYC